MHPENGAFICENKSERASLGVGIMGQCTGGISMATKGMLVAIETVVFIYAALETNRRVLGGKMAAWAERFDFDAVQWILKWGPWFLCVVFLSGCGHHVQRLVPHYGAFVRERQQRDQQNVSTLRSESHQCSVCSLSAR